MGMRHSRAGVFDHLVWREYNGAESEDGGLQVEEPQ